MEDPIEKLKTDDIQISQQEKQLLQELFPKEYDSTVRRRQLFEEFQNVFFLGIIFFLINFSVTETAIQYIFPLSKNTLILLIIKTILFILIVWILLNISYLMRK